MKGTTLLRSYFDKRCAKNLLGLQELAWDRVVAMPMAAAMPPQSSVPAAWSGKQSDILK